MPSPLICNNNRARVELQESAHYIRTWTKSSQPPFPLLSNYLPSFKPASFNEKFLLKAQGKSVASDLQSFPGGTDRASACRRPRTFLDGPAETQAWNVLKQNQSCGSGSLTLTEAHLAVTGLWFPLKQVVAPASRPSRFHFVSNLISQEAEPRYGFLVNILDPATPDLKAAPGKPYRQHPGN